MYIYTVDFHFIFNNITFIYYILTSLKPISFFFFFCTVSIIIKALISFAFTQLFLEEFFLLIF